jgi:2-methylfumaryl-CoA isomerase
VSDLPLAGLTVVEIATFVAGPSAGLTMAQLGADVIRVDPLGGAIDYKRWPITEDGSSLYWHSLNRNKRSVAIDLRSAAGRDVVRRMIAAPGPDRGVLVDNQPNADWLSWSALSALREDLIHVHIEGHRDGRPAVDYTVNAEAGVPLITGPAAGDEPVNQVLPAWDLLCGLSTVTAVLAALRRRDRTGAGGRVDIALADIALASVANLGWYSEAVRGVDRAPIGNAIYGSYGSSFPTKDGRHVMVVALTPHQWRALVEVTGTADQAAALEVEHGVDFARDEAARYAHRAALGELLGPWFAAHDADDVSTALASARALWAPYRTVAQAADRGEGPLTALDQPGLGSVVSATSPQRWQGVETANHPAARLGADTTSVLRELAGLDDTELASLVADGVIASDS